MSYPTLLCRYRALFHASITHYKNITRQELTALRRLAWLVWHLNLSPISARLGRMSVDVFYVYINILWYGNFRLCWIKKPQYWILCVWRFYLLIWGGGQPRPACVWVCQGAIKLCLGPGPGWDMLLLIVNCSAMFTVCWCALCGVSGGGGLW